MSGQSSELDRLRLQSLVWEPAGNRLLDRLGTGTDLRVLDVGCGCLGWLRILSNWVGRNGSCVGTEISQTMAEAAEVFCKSEDLTNVQIIIDDLFESSLPRHSFDLVHARFQLAPIGRFEEQVNCFLQLLASGGVLVLEDPDTSTWSFIPPAPKAMELIDFILKAFKASAGDLDAGRIEFELLKRMGLEPQIRAEVEALPPGHPYLALPLQFATSLRPKLLQLCEESYLDELVNASRDEILSPNCRGLSYTLIQTWASVPNLI